jgi:protein-disulfide isomerase
MKSDSNKPFIIGMIVLAVVMVAGIGYAVSQKRSSDGRGTYDANVSFTDDQDPVTGNSNAPVVVRLFDDFQCPACKIGKPGIDYVRQTYGDRVKIVWNDFPLESLHPNARLAANAARCAEEQGTFWEYADALYSTQEMWSGLDTAKATDAFGGYAERLGLNRGVFEGCLDEKRYDGKISADFSEGIANRVDSTPTFFIGKDRFSGAMSSEQWNVELQKRLGSAK